MKVLLWWPGADIAVHDVATGLNDGLQAAGVQVNRYRTDMRLIAACQYLRQVWRARGKRPAEKPTMNDAVRLASMGILEVALAHQPDWLISVAGLYQHPDAFVFLKRAGIKVALVCTETPYDLAAELQLARLVDHVWTNERSTLPVFRTVIESASYLRHAWHPDVHRAGVTDTVDVPAHDVVFVGTAFIERIRLLEAIDWTGIDLGLYGSWDLLGSRSPLRRCLRGKNIPNARAAALYRKAAIGLNFHRTSTQFGRDVRHVARAESLNPRAYELAACGCFTISDWRPEVNEIFGAALPTFRSPGELEAQIRHWLAAGEDARRDRAAEQVHAVECETWNARALQVVADLRTHDARRRRAVA